jgi:anthranilate phosphoribosyltransferase
MDEISVSGKTRVSWLRRGKVETLDMTPEDFGVDSKAIVARADGPEHSVRMALQILEGDGEGQATTEMVVANSAAALVVGGLAPDFRDAAERARNSLSSGAALEKLRNLVKAAGGDISRIEVHATG